MGNIIVHQRSFSLLGLYRKILSDVVQTICEDYNLHLLLEK